jgi:hypothetical protein
MTEPRHTAPDLGLSRQTKRRIKRLGDELDVLLGADRNFFERRPDRSYRIRRCFRQEIEINQLMSPEMRKPLPGLTWFTLVRQIAPGARLRIFIQGPPDAETDLPEAAVEELWNAKAAAMPKVRDYESKIETAIREHRP